ncbi:hypothetical protein [Halomarina rubra]|uniref:HMA domain-containing protein n=1 Tax=Halomarina rubra TaxID=2071873 RepID=A0ABD6B047_9EURY|nr:hypothetical protein [Halomarina rubra]
MPEEQTRRLLRVEGASEVLDENTIRRRVFQVDGLTEFEFDRMSGWLDLVGDTEAVERAVVAIRDLGYHVR